MHPLAAPPLELPLAPLLLAAGLLVPLLPLALPADPLIDAPPLPLLEEVVFAAPPLPVAALLPVGFASDPQPVTRHPRATKAKGSARIDRMDDLQKIALVAG